MSSKINVCENISIKMEYRLRELLSTFPYTSNFCKTESTIHNKTAAE